MRLQTLISGMYSRHPLPERCTLGQGIWLYNPLDLGRNLYLSIYLQNVIDALAFYVNFRQMSERCTSMVKLWVTMLLSPQIWQKVSLGSYVYLFSTGGLVVSSVIDKRPARFPCPKFAWSSIYPFVWWRFHGYNRRRIWASSPSIYVSCQAVWQEHQSAVQSSTQRTKPWLHSS